LHVRFRDTRLATDFFDQFREFVGKSGSHE
jgi:hypothetical protein